METILEQSQQKYDVNHNAQTWWVRQKGKRNTWGQKETNSRMIMVQTAFDAQTLASSIKFKPALMRKRPSCVWWLQWVWPSIRRVFREHNWTGATLVAVTGNRVYNVSAYAVIAPRTRKPQRWIVFWCMSRRRLLRTRPATTSTNQCIGSMLLLRMRRSMGHPVIGYMGANGSDLLSVCPHFLSRVSMSVFNCMLISWWQNFMRWL